MHTMRLRAALVAVCLCLSACTGGQLARWLPWYEADPAAAMTAALSYGEVKAAATDGHPCPEWYDEAIDAGFTPAQWEEPLSRIMNRESRCDPDAHNPSGATGLVQIMPMWADDCGGVPSDLYDPAFNLACALHVLDVSSWQAWTTL